MINGALLEKAIWLICQLCIAADRECYSQKDRYKHTTGERRCHYQEGYGNGQSTRADAKSSCPTRQIDILLCPFLPLIWLYISNYVVQFLIYNHSMDKLIRPISRRFRTSDSVSVQQNNDRSQLVSVPYDVRIFLYRPFQLVKYVRYLYLNQIVLFQTRGQLQFSPNSYITKNTS